MKVVRIGTRRSALALRQTELVRDALRATVNPSEISFEIVEMMTTGDRKQGTPAAFHGDKKDWVLEFEQGLLRGEIDLAVHSAKDVPVEIEPGTALRPVLRRASPLDVLVVRSDLAANGVRVLSDLPSGARIGTSSPRRRAGMRHARPDLRLIDLKGNVPTRLNKLLTSGELDAIVLAAAGLERLGFTELNAQTIDAHVSLPAMNQGIIAVQLRADGADLDELLRPLIDPHTAAQFAAERATIRVLNADCDSAVGVLAATAERSLSLSGRVLDRDGSRAIESAAIGALHEAERLGTTLGDDLIARGARELL